MRVPKSRRTEERTKSLRRIATPYSYYETLGILRRNFKGIDTKRNAGIVQPAPRSVVLHEGDVPVTRVGFVGDIMNIDNKALSFSEALHEWADQHEVLVGNFEATIHDSKEREGIWWGSHQPQAERIVSDLAKLFDPSKFYLGLANNHSGDYRKSVFDRSNRMIEKAGFPLFGMKESPFIDIHEDVRIVAGTMWSNQKADDILWLPKPHEADGLRRAGAANVFYPHWGFELEAWPRRFLVKQAREFAKCFDAIIGHHAHNPQPLELHDGVPIAYGLGDFCFYYDLPTYRYGMIVSLDIGRPVAGGNARVSGVRWDPIVNRHDPENILVDMAAKPANWLVGD